MTRWRYLLICMVLHAIAAGGLASDEPDQDEPVCATDFESSDTLGLYKTLEKHELLEVVDGQGVDGSKALKATYKGYERGSERISTQFQLPRRLDEATLVFDVKFEKGFQFVKGGKLNGLGPDHPITGGSDMKPEGWSARAMWHKDSLGSYVYCQNKKRKFGQGPDKTQPFTFQTGRYDSVSLYVKINEPADKANGVMRVYVNGKLVAQDSAIQFRGVEGDQTRISQLIFSTFHGGHSPEWAPKDEEGNYTEVHAYFDNLAVYEGLHVRKKPGEP